MTPDSLQPANCNVHFQLARVAGVEWERGRGRWNLSARERERHAGRGKKETPPRMPEFFLPLPILTSAMQVN